MFVFQCLHRLFRRWTIKTVAVALLIVLFAAPVPAVASEEYQVSNAGDLAALCGRDPSALDYVAAQNFGHGYTVGAYAYYHSVSLADPDLKIVCVKEPYPERKRVLADFVAWGQGPPRPRERTGGGHVFPVPGRDLPLQVTEDRKEQKRCKPRGSSPFSRYRHSCSRLRRHDGDAAAHRDGSGDQRRRQGRRRLPLRELGWGAAGGYIYDQTVKSKDKAYKDGYEAGKKSATK